MPRKAHTTRTPLTLIHDPDAENCFGCFFAAPNFCRKGRDERYKNISCVGKASDGSERMGKFVKG